MNTEGKPAAAEGLGYAGIGRTYDAKGALTEAWYLDARGKPVAISGGCAGVKILSDENGRPASPVTFVDISGKSNCPRRQ